MNCEKIKAILITDYIDGRLDGVLKNSIDHHLVHCQDCKVYLNMIKCELINPLQRVVHAQVDENLWEAIKNNIESKQESESSLNASFWKNFLHSIYFPKPAFVLAGLLMGIVFVGTTGQLMESMRLISVNNHAQAQYISSLISYPSESEIKNITDDQSSIEEYFL